MYYGNGLGEERDLIAESRDLLQGKCFDYSLDKCLWPEGWEDDVGDEVPPFPNCDLLLAAMASDPEAFNALTDEMPYCTYRECKMPREATFATVGIAAAALGVGFLLGAWAL